MQFVTTKQHRYRGKLRKIGDSYEIAGKSDARLVQALGWSIPAPVVVAPVVVTKVTTRVKAPAVVAPVFVAPVADPAPIVEQAPEVIAEPAPKPTPEEQQFLEYQFLKSGTDKPKRAYKRRDLSAE